jgi:CheY-like chemotaxis protein
VTKNDLSVSPVECALLVEDAVARLRHDVFNSLAAVRNAAYYLQRRFNNTETWQSDPRVEQFFQLIGQQLDVAVARIGVDPKADLPHQRRARLVDGAACVRDGLERLSGPLPPERLDASISSGKARVDPDELELAIHTTCAYLLQAVPGAQLSVEAGPIADGYQIELTARAPRGETTIPVDTAALPRSLIVARRVAVAAGGRFALERSPELVCVTLTVPDAGEQKRTTRVLIVDDELAGRATLAALLELDGHEVRECGTLAQANSALSSGEVFDAVLIDRKLPDGRGDTLAAAIHNTLPNASLILMTGEAVDTAPPGFHAAYQKGMDPTILTGLVGQLLQADTGD